MRNKKQLIVVGLGISALVACAILAPRAYSAWRKRQLISRILNTEEWNSWREAREQVKRIPFWSLDLSGADLSGADLSGANLRAVDLVGANLSGANLSRANLVGAGLSGANLSGASLIRTNLVAADLLGADLSRADLSSAGLGLADLTRADLSNAKLGRAILKKANLKWADLSNIKDWNTVNFKDANIFEVRNPPPGFVEYARGQGAIEREEMWDDE